MLHSLASVACHLIQSLIYFVLISRQTCEEEKKKEDSKRRNKMKMSVKRKMKKVMKRIRTINVCPVFACYST